MATGDEHRDRPDEERSVDEWWRLMHSKDRGGEAERLIESAFAGSESEAAVAEVDALVADLRERVPGEGALAGAVGWHELDAETAVRVIVLSRFADAFPDVPVEETRKVMTGLEESGVFRGLEQMWLVGRGD
jgi:hypothetical protein